MKSQKSQVRQQLDRRLHGVRASIFVPPSRGWIRAIRRALGMNSRQLADRLGVKQPRVADIEKRELDSALTMRTLRRVAQALDCQLVYAFIPNEGLEKTVLRRATAIADQRLRAVAHSMALEDQAVSHRTFKRQRAQLIEEIIENEPHSLWNEGR